MHELIIIIIISHPISGVINFHVVIIIISYHIIGLKNLLLRQSKFIHFFFFFFIFIINFDLSFLQSFFHSFWFLLLILKILFLYFFFSFFSFSWLCCLLQEMIFKIKKLSSFQILKLNIFVFLNRSHIWSIKAEFVYFALSWLIKNRTRDAL